MVVVIRPCVRRRAAAFNLPADSAPPAAAPPPPT